MLVQLDTGDIARLEDISVRDQGAFQTFASEWNAHKFVLALNLHHAQEIAQQDNPDSRRRRLGLIKLLDDVRFSGVAEFGLLRQEIAAMLDAVANKEPPRFSELRDYLFPKSSGTDFENYVLENLDDLRKIRITIEQTIALHNQEPRERRRRLLKNVKLTPEASAMAEERVRDAINHSDLTADQRESFLKFFERIAKSFFGQPNQRAGLERHHAVDGLAWIGRVPDSDLELAAGFADIARDLLEEGRGILPTTPSEEELLNQLDPYSAPGTRIQFAVRRGQRAAGRLEAAHETDRSHAVFAPYVDFAFVDRQTATFLSQESLRRPDLLYASDLATVNPSGPVETIIHRVLNSRQKNTTIL